MRMLFTLLPAMTSLLVILQTASWCILVTQVHQGKTIVLQGQPFLCHWSQLTLIGPNLVLPVRFHGPDLYTKLRSHALSFHSFSNSIFSYSLVPDIYLCSVTARLKWIECLIISLKRTANINKVFLKSFFSLFFSKIWCENLETARQLVC